MVHDALTHGLKVLGDASVDENYLNIHISAKETLKRLLARREENEQDEKEEF